MRELALLLSYHVENNSPIEPIVDHLIESRIHTGAIGSHQLLAEHPDAFDGLDVAHLVHRMYIAGDRVDRMVYDLGHHELCDWVPF